MTMMTTTIGDFKFISYENINRSISTKYLYSTKSRKVSGNFSILLIIDNNSKLNTGIKNSMIAGAYSTSPSRSLFRARAPNESSRVELCYKQIESSQIQSS